MDKIYKVNLYLMRKYKDDLINNYKIKDTTIPEEMKAIMLTIFKQEVDMDQAQELFKFSQIIDMMFEEINKEFPDPWYCYGLGTINK